MQKKFPLCQNLSIQLKDLSHQIPSINSLLQTVFKNVSNDEEISDENNFIVKQKDGKQLKLKNNDSSLNLGFEEINQKPPEKQLNFFDQKKVRNFPDSSEKSKKQKFLKISPQKKFHKTKKKYQCTEPNCTKQFTFQSEFQRHMLSHGNKQFLCEICQKQFKREDTLKSHQQIHNQIKPFTCSVCNKQFSAQSGLRYHLLKHENDYKYTCSFSFCTKKFLTQ